MDQYENSALISLKKGKKGTSGRIIFQGPALNYYLIRIEDF